MSNLYPVKCPFCSVVITSVLGKSSCANCENDITVVEIKKNNNHDVYYMTVEGLKRNWKADPIWNIEDSDGFGDYHDELLAWRKAYEAECATRNEIRYQLVMEQTGITDFDITSALSTFSEIENEIMRVDRQAAENEDNGLIVALMTAQARAALLQAAQLKRIADALEKMNDGGDLVSILNAGTERE